MDTDGIKFWAAVLGLIAALLAGLWQLAEREQAEWDAFAAAHKCVVVGKQSGSTSFGVGVGSKGAVPVSVYTPGKTGYACDDGVTYWR